ncbi:MAG: YiaA/YiaB family inner membrane protein, partial [Candidatus Xenobia bacterium]
MIAVLMVTFGIWHLPVEPLIQAYFGMASFFLMGSTFTLSKTIRDNHEVEQSAPEVETPYSL